MKKINKLYLVRHGESAGNIDKSLYFKLHDSLVPLTEIGKEQAKKAALKILEIHGGRFYGDIISSPFLRAKETADIIINTILSHPLGECDSIGECPQLRERMWGQLREITASGQKTEEHFNFYYRPEGGESFADCYDRVACFHNWLCMNYAYTNNPVIIVAHGELNKLYTMFLQRWTVEEFERWRTPRNGQVLLFNNGKLDNRTQLQEKPLIKH